MPPETLLAGTLIILIAIALNWWLMRWAQRHWQVDEAEPQVRVWGRYSPILTWLKYRRLPALKPLPPALVTEATPGFPPASNGVPSASQELINMSSSEISPVPLASAENAPAPQAAPAAEAAADRPVPPAPRPAAPQARPEASWNLALAVAALALALIGQFYFSNVHDDLWDGVWFFGVGVALFLILARRSEAKPGEGAVLVTWFRQVRDRIRSEPMRAALILVSFALTYTNMRLLKNKPGNESFLDAFTLWVLSSACFAAVFVRLPRIDLRAWARRYRLEILAVAGLTGAALLFRLWALGALPNVISGDEGRIGLLGESVLKGEIKNMMATIYGHSTLYLFIIGGFIRVLGANPFGLRFASALGGALTVPALYLLARRMFNIRVALVAAALLTLSHFHLHFSRIVVAGSVQDALFATVAFYFFLTGLEERSAGRLVLSGLTIGLHLYIYMGARLLILLMPVYVAFLFITNRELVRQNLGNLLAFLGALAVVSAPMALWAILQPGEFMARANQVGIIQSGWLAAEAVKLHKSQISIFIAQVRQAFLTVNYYPATGFYYAKLPMLDFVSGATFMLGIAYSLYHVFDRRHLLLQGWFWSSVVVGGALVVLPGDAAYRIMIMFPAVCIFVGLGWDRLIEFGGQVIASRRVRAGALTALFIAAIAVPNFKAYFVDYAPTCRYEDWGTRFASKMGIYLGQLGPGYTPYLLGAPRIYYGIHPSVDFLSGSIPVINVNDVLTGPPPVVDPHSRAVFILIPEREGELAFIQSYMPGGEVQRLYDCKDLQMIIYKVDGSAAP